MSRRLRLYAIVIFALGIALVIAGGCASAWTWTTTDTHPAFRYVLPLLTAWLVVALVKLALNLRRAARADVDDWPDPLVALQSAPRRPPDAAVRAVWPDAESCQQVLLPPEAGAVGLARRRRIALRVVQPGGQQRLIVAPGRSALRALQRRTPP